MARKHRGLALLLAVLCLVLVAAPFLVAAEAHHDCVGEGCPVCAQLAALEHLLRGAGLGMLSAAAISLALAGTALLGGAGDPSLPSVTPVTLKVKISD